jgi:hypothetical protein
MTVYRSIYVYICISIYIYYLSIYLYLPIYIYIYLPTYLHTKCIHSTGKTERYDITSVSQLATKPCSNIDEETRLSFHS